MVFSGQRDRQKILAHRDLALAHEIEGRFEIVREGRHLIEAEHRARAFYRVKGTESGIYEVSIGCCFVEVEKRSFEAVEQFTGLLPVTSAASAIVICAHSLVTTARSCSGLKGLVIQPVAPAALASCLALSSDSVVRNTIGIPTMEGTFRKCRIRSKPFITGMLRSVITISMALDLALTKPSIPSVASITVYPAPLKTV